VLRGFSIIAKVREGREETVRAYGKTIEETIASSPEVLAPLRLHYLRWVRDSCAFERGIGRWNRHSPTRFRIGSVPSQPSAAVRTNSARPVVASLSSMISMIATGPPGGTA
jgi:hypothetical protein